MNPKFLSLLAAAVCFSAFAAAQSVQITEIEVNQAVGKQLNGALNFVAGKDTVVRVYLDSAVAIQADQTSLAIKRDDTDVVTLAPRPTTDPVNMVEFVCPTRADCGGWAAGSYLFTAKVNGVTKTTEGASYVFRTRIGLRILARPVKANYNGTIVPVADDRWRKSWEYTRKVYPVAADGIFWDVREELDASDPKFNLETEEGQFALWQALANLVPQHCTANPKGAGCYDLVVGFIQARPNGYPNGTLQGYTMGRPANIVVASDQDMEATISHEIAHLFGAGDTYDGGSFNCTVNPAPDGFNGKDFNDASKTASCTAGRVTYPNASATKIDASSRIYEVGGRGALPDSADFMGSGTLQANFWITPEVYNQVFNGLDPNPPAAQPKSKSKSHDAAALQRLLFYEGSINATGTVRLAPWYGMLSAEPSVDSTGDTQIQAVDSTGNVLSSQAINPQFFVVSRPPRTITWAPFEGALRFPDGTVKFQIVKSGAVLSEVAVSANDPTVTAVTPVTEGQTLDGPQTITWAAADADNDALTFSVEYNPNPADPNTEWLVLATDLTSAQWQDDFSTLPGAKAAAIRVTATDGVRAVTAQSQAFAVAFKAPWIYLDDLATTTFNKGAEVFLSAEVEDLQDGILEDQKLVWSSDVSGKLGTGSDLTTTSLPVGVHNITLTATNSAGLSTTKTVTITIQ